MRGAAVQEPSHVGCCTGFGSRLAVDFLRIFHDSCGSDISCLQRGFQARFLVMNPFRVFALAAGIVPVPAVAATIDYNRDIRPILSENCFSCHGPDEKARKAKLRLDLAESAHAEREGVTPFKPGDPEHSEAWSRITSDGCRGDDAAAEIAPHAHRRGEGEAQGVDRAGREVCGALVVHPAGQSGDPVPAAGAQSDRCLRSGAAGRGGLEAVAGGGPRDAHPPRVARSHRPAAVGGGGGGVRQRPRSAGLRQASSPAC